MERLKGSRVYLCGPIDNAADYGQGWRNNLKPFLKKLGIVCIDPCDKPIDDQYKEGPEFIKLRKTFKRIGDWAALQKMMKKVRVFDLRCVDIVDFLIVYLDLDLTICGTWEELFWANRQKKPVLIMCKQGVQNIPDWLFGTLPYQHFFNDWLSLQEYINMVNSSELEPDHYKRWTFFQYEKLV